MPLLLGVCPIPSLSRTHQLSTQGADGCAAGIGPSTVPLVVTYSRGSLLQTQEAMGDAVLLHERAGAVIMEAPLQHADLCLTPQACLCIWSQQLLQVRSPWCAAMSLTARHGQKLRDPQLPCQSRQSLQCCSGRCHHSCSVLQADSDPSLQTARQLLARQLLYTSCAYSRVHLCIQGSPDFLAALAPVVHSLGQHAYALDVSLSMLTATSTEQAKVRPR